MCRLRKVRAVDVMLSVVSRDLIKRLLHNHIGGLQDDLKRVEMEETRTKLPPDMITYKSELKIRLVEANLALKELT